MLSITNTLEKETYDKFGYYPSRIGKYAQKQIIVKCSHCKLIYEKPKREENNRHRCPQIVEGKKYCVCCKEQREIDEFGPSKHTLDKLKRVCRECARAYESNNRDKLYRQKLFKRSNNLRLFLSSKLSSCKSRAQSKSMQFDLDLDYLEDLFKKQKGKCYYSGIELNLENKAPRSVGLSIDRLDPSKGYLKGNVVFCTFSINSMKGVMSEAEFKNYLRIVLPLLNDYIA